MKNYDLSNLTIITISSEDKKEYNKTHLICENHINQITQETYWIEIFSGQKITIYDLLENNFENTPFSYYFRNLVELNKGIKFSKIELLHYYNELNKIELLRNIDEKDIEEYLVGKDRYKLSKVYMNKLYKKI